MLEETKNIKPIRRIYKVRSGKRPMSPEAMRARSEAHNKAVRIEQSKYGYAKSTFSEPLQPPPSRKNSCKKRRNPALKPQ